MKYNEDFRLRNLTQRRQGAEMRSRSPVRAPGLQLVGRVPRPGVPFTVSPFRRGSTLRRIANLQAQNRANSLYIALIRDIARPVSPSVRFNSR